MKRIRFWQNIISPHQIETIKALSRKEEVEVSLVVIEALSDQRKKMGFSVPDTGNIDLVVGMTNAVIERQLTKQADIEIFTAPWGYPPIRSAFNAALKRKATIAIVSETPDWRGISGWLRRQRGRAHAIRYGRKLAFILAIGSLAQLWYTSCGYPEKIVFPFAYTVQPPVDLHVRCVSSDGPFKILFIGNLVRLKGVDILLYALRSQTENAWTLDIVGDGPSRNLLEILSKRYGIADKICFRGAIGHAETMAVLEAADLLVLPSRKDGWGAVVNEALHRGVPVLCSDTCGAKSIVRPGINGEIFRSGSVSDLERKLAPALAGSDSFPHRSEVIRELSGVFSGEAVASYLLEVVECVLGAKVEPPTPPWSGGSTRL